MRVAALAAAMSVGKATARLKAMPDPEARDRLRLEWQREYAADVARRHEPKRQPTTDLDHERLRLAQQKRDRKAVKLKAQFKEA